MCGRNLTTCGKICCGYIISSWCVYNDWTKSQRVRVYDFSSGYVLAFSRKIQINYRRYTFLITAYILESNQFKQQFSIAIRLKA